MVTSSEKYKENGTEILRLDEQDPRNYELTDSRKLAPRFNFVLFVSVKWEKIDAIWDGRNYGFLEKEPVRFRCIDKHRMNKNNIIQEITEWLVEKMALDSIPTVLFWKWEKFMCFGQISTGWTRRFGY